MSVEVLETISVAQMGKAYAEYDKTVRVLRLNAPNELTDQWPTFVSSTDELLEEIGIGAHVRYRVVGRGSDVVVFTSMGRGAVVNLQGGLVSVQVVADSVTVARSFMDEIKEHIPPASTTDDLHVPFTFWSLSQHGPRETNRKIEAVDWEKVWSNYPTAVKDQLGELVTEWRPSSGGQLLLWHGPPGTGKTYALRSLAWQWRSWCSMEYVTDPNAFFGDADYMMQVLLHNGDGLVSSDDVSAEDRWRLLILEDTGELLMADSKQQMGQGLSRLLNVVDGIIGQGLKVIVLITTNEEVHNFNPAVIRPGRCASLIEFPRFSGAEATHWLRERGVEDLHKSGSTVAELYAILEDRSFKRSKVPVGF